MNSAVVVSRLPLTTNTMCLVLRKVWFVLDDYQHLLVVLLKLEAKQCFDLREVKSKMCFNLNLSLFQDEKEREKHCQCFIIGPESDHWECLSVTPSLTDSLTAV